MNSIKIARLFLLLLRLLLASTATRACQHHHQPDNRQLSTNSNKPPAVLAAGRSFASFNEWTKDPEFRTNRRQMQCGTQDPTAKELKVASKVTQQWMIKQGASTGTRQRQKQSRSSIVIPVKWHSIAQDDGSAAATDQQILDSVAALNRAFKHPSSDGFAFVFDLSQDKTETWNTDWHYAGPEDDFDYKSQLRLGDCQTLNIYSTGDIDGILGWGSKPFRCDDDDDDDDDEDNEDSHDDCYNRCEEELEKDGVVIRYETVTGGEADDYNEGDVLVHEVGHWLGLYHTFQNGCDAPGDYIMDTPAEAEPAGDCDEVKDTCTGDEDFPAGVDPIHNFMNLSQDSCMFEFTDGQFAWMYAQWEAYRFGSNVEAELERDTNTPTFTPTTNAPTVAPSPSPTPKTSSFISFSVTIPTPSPTPKTSSVTSFSVNIPPSALTSYDIFFINASSSSSVATTNTSNNQSSMEEMDNQEDLEVLIEVNQGAVAAIEADEEEDKDDKDYGGLDVYIGY